MVGFDSDHSLASGRMPDPCRVLGHVTRGKRKGGNWPSSLWLACTAKNNGAPGGEGHVLGTECKLRNRDKGTFFLEGGP